MCLTVSLAGPDFALLATDRYVYAHRHGAFVGATDLGRAKLGRVGASGWATGGGDARFILGALQELRDADPNDVDRMGSIIRAAAARHPEGERSGIEVVWWSGTAFRSGSYNAAGEFNPARPGAPRISWPGSPDPADVSRVGREFCQNAQNALQSDEAAVGLGAAVGALFVDASRVSRWIGESAEVVLVVPDGAGGIRAVPISTDLEECYVA